MTAANSTETGGLAHFPVTFFAVVLGLGGLTLALSSAGPSLGFGPVPALLAYGAMVAAFTSVALCYLAKVLRHRWAVAAEWNNPDEVAFFPAISISMVVLATATLPYHRPLAEAVWMAGAVLQTVLTVAVISSWIGNRAFLHRQLSPAWFLPAVGNVIVPVAGVQLGYVEISWYFMSVGLIFWGVLLTLVINRLIFHDPLSERLQPTLVILIAPPSVAYLAWLQLTGEVGAFGRILLNGAYFFTLIVVVQMPKILKLPFVMSFWALSFPFAAVTVASFAHAGAAASPMHRAIGTGLLAVLCVIIAALSLRTCKAIARREVFEPA